jgi:hypothetical protein
VNTENVELQLDLLRNRILRFELFLSISSFVISCGALITGKDQRRGEAHTILILVLIEQVYLE